MFSIRVKGLGCQGLTHSHMCSGSIQDDVHIFHVCSPHLPRPSTKLIWGVHLAWTQWWTGAPFSNYPKSSNQLICIYLVFLRFLQPTSRNLVTSRLHFVTITQVSHAFIRRSSDLLLVISCYFPIQHPEWTLYLTQKIIESFFPYHQCPYFPGYTHEIHWNPPFSWVMSPEKRVPQMAPMVMAAFFTWSVWSHRSKAFEHLCGSLAKWDAYPTVSMGAG